ncbi:MAG: tellurite resistance/C4-dicarboxylate transporter family protein [Solirubrobacteraceae bacterium]
MRATLRWRLARPHGRPWAGAFNVVMATAIVSIASHDAGLTVPSIVLMWLAVLAFAVLATLDVARARHPVTLLHRAERPDQGFAALGFVADTCVLGSRITTDGPVPHVIATVLLVLGASVWLAIFAQLARSHAGGDLRAARGEWLLAVVATEGISILAAQLGILDRSHALIDISGAAWAVGGVLYLAIELLLVLRVRSRSLVPTDITPDVWIVMGALAIFALGAASLIHAGRRTPENQLGVAAWFLAAAWIAPLIAAEGWRWRRAGRPRFDVARWTMVFPLGMFSAASQALGHALSASWMVSIGRGWLVLALAAWTTLALGELHHAFSPKRIS